MGKMFFRILYLVAFITAFVSAAVVDSPRPSLNETDAGRFVFAIPGLLQRTYDVSGQKSEWLWGTSILGAPDLDRSSMGISAPSHRFPGKLAGLYTTPLTYDTFHPSLAGANGILREKSELAPLDTPVTALVWERGAFDGNALRLEFRRQLVDSLRLDLGLASHSNRESKDFVYAAVTHQPFFALGRDSSDIPFGGRNIALNTMHLRPAITWLFGMGELSFKANLLFLDIDDNARFLPVQDTADYSIYHYAASPFSTSLSGQSYEATLALHPVKKLTLGTSISTGSYEINYENLPKYVKSVKDTILELTNSLGEIVYDTTQDTTWSTLSADKEYETVSGTVFAKWNGFLNPSLFFEYEFLTLNSDFEQDAELGYAELSETFGFLNWRLLGGAKRNSSVNDDVKFLPVFSAEATITLPFHFKFWTQHRMDSRFPEVEELKVTERGRILYPNDDLQAEKHRQSSAELSWNGGGIFYALGFRHEYAEDLIKENWVSGKGLNSESEALQLKNFGEAETWDWIVRAGLALGNWTFYGERGEMLWRKGKLMDTPRLYYKGSVAWGSRFVSNRLGVQVKLDFEWFGARYDIAMVADSLDIYRGNVSSLYVGKSIDGKHLEIVPLSKYLALHFEARMNILSFDLYARIENLNHSQMQPAIGYTPEGIRFLYGIVWSFKN